MTRLRPTSNAFTGFGWNSYWFYFKNPSLRWYASSAWKYVYWPEVGRRDKADPAKVVDAALLSVHVTGQAAVMTKAAMLRNPGYSA